MKVRILPILIFVLGINLIFKISSVQKFVDQFHKKLEDQTILSEISLAANDAVAEGEEKEANSENEEAKNESEKEEENKKDVALAQEIPGASRVKPNHITPMPYSEAELEILQNLSKRRAKLESMEQDFQRKVSMLKATENKINSKIQEMKYLEKEIQNLMEFYNAKQEEKTIKLVKIYENMKPKDAAKIFEVLDMDILLAVFYNMKEMKLASILANMDPEKSREITVKYSEYKRLKNDKRRIND